MGVSPPILDCLPFSRLVVTTCHRCLPWIALPERGLQLHLLSVLGEIWRERDRVNQCTVKDGFVLLSVVMDTERTEQENFSTEARGLLRESGKNRPCVPFDDRHTIKAKPFIREGCSITSNRLRGAVQCSTMPFFLCHSYPLTEGRKGGCHQNQTGRGESAAPGA